MVYACDRQYWNAYAARIAKLCPDAEPWTINAQAAKVHGLNAIGHEKRVGVSARPNTVSEGGNSGFQAVGLALLFGAARVVLLGYDMQATGRRLHWHADHQDKLANPVPAKFKDWQRNFAVLASETDVPVVNCSRETGLACFPRAPLKEVLA